MLGADCARVGNTVGDPLIVVAKVFVIVRSFSEKLLVKGSTVTVSGELLVMETK